MANQFEFYELNDKGDFTAQPRSYLWYIVGAVTLVLVIAVVVLLVVNRQKDQVVRNEVVDTGALEQQMQDCIEAGTDEVSCGAVAATETAATTGKVDECESLSGAARTNCVETVAIRQDNEKTCNALNGTDKDQCKDRVNLFGAVDTNDSTRCSKIASASLKSSCERQFSTETPGYIGLVETGSPEDCAQFEDEGGCLEQFYDTDSDGDGLSDYDEFVIWNTDRFNADTDGDGYTDGDEVQNGFDPLN